MSLRRTRLSIRSTLAIGASYPLGAPRFTRATLVGDIFAEQAFRHGDPTTVGTELGLRYQLTPRMVWDVGVGTEFVGPAERSGVRHHSDTVAAGK